MTQYAEKKQRKIFVFGFLLLQILIVISSIALIQSKHEVRSLFSSIQQLHDARDKLNNDWSKLLLEQSFWAGDARIDEIARKDLKLNSPKANQVILVKL